jgi:hypothetical protein
MSAKEGFTVCQRGILCRKNDAVAFARGLKYLITMDRKQRDPMTNEARGFVVQTFSNERLLRDMEKLYLEIVPPPVKNS